MVSFDINVKRVLYSFVNEKLKSEKKLFVNVKGVDFFG
jgi:hypothetical protein